jgi:PAS domain S-box-containing protein
MMDMKKNVRILIIEDDEDDFIILSEYIRHVKTINAEINWCSSYDDALSQMCSKQHDLYFLDYRLGAKSGVTLLKEAIDNNCEDPVILLTGKGNYEVDVQAMQLGAVDYLIKTELNVEKVDRCIRYALERDAAMKALSANERKFRSIFEKSKDIIFTADSNLYIKEVNPAVYDFLGYTREECCSINLAELIEQAQHRKFLLHTLKSGKGIKDWEVQLRASNGEYKSCIITAALENNPDNSTYVQGIIHDITNIKKVESATLKAEKLAMVGRLVHTLAHEVRNPLNNITLSLEQMVEDVHDEGTLSYLNIIDRNSKRINQLIKELLNTSQPVEAQLKPELLTNIIDEVMAAAIDRLTLKKIALNIAYPEKKVKILADRSKLTIALLNIVINAIEAMEENKGVLSVRVRVQDEHAVVQIEDNGCGISKENLTKLFEPYFTQKRNGVGLGLAFTLNILQGHSANVEANSELGVFTIFTITFPVA